MLLWSRSSACHELSQVKSKLFQMLSEVEALREVERGFEERQSQSKMRRRVGRGRVARRWWAEEEEEESWGPLPLL